MLWRLVVVALSAWTGYRIGVQTEAAPAALVALTGGRFAVAAAVVAAVIGLLVSFVVPYAVKVTLGRAIAALQRLPLPDTIAGAIGLLVGLAIASLAILPFPLRLPLVGEYLPAVLTIGCGYVAMIVAVRRRDDLLSLLGLGRYTERGGRERSRTAKGGYKLLDTSAIIDGRIADLAGSGFLPGDLVVPQFVLRELQLVADSSDLSRRERGHRGLDILDRLKRDASERLQIVELDVLDEPDVDSKLLRLAQRNGFRILTGDRNLERVATLQAVRVLNIHHLANILRPPIVPGEEMELKIIQPGREYDQGVGYLTDGTMVVVESGKNLIGQDVKVIVTRTLQTGAGRMAFAHVVSKETA